MELTLCIFWFWLEKSSQFLSILIPIILFIWFLYSRRQNNSNKYFRELEGVYAGFTQPISDIEEKKSINAGIIMHIRDVDDKGYFRGEFDYGENLLTLKDSIPKRRMIRVGVHTFLGKLNYKNYKNKDRYPLNTNDNRKYIGTLYIFSRLDFPFETNKMKDYLNSEYEIIHYREMKILNFNLKIIHNENSQELPKSFTLYKSVGLAFEPLKGVQEIVFQNELKAT